MLNDFLYQRLHAIFGNVKVAYEGESVRYKVINDRVEVIEHGETYRVNCPRCLDSKFHLYIPYYFNAIIDGFKFPRVVKCFKDCGITGEDIAAMLSYPSARLKSTVTEKLESPTKTLLQIDHQPVTAYKQTEAYIYLKNRGFSDDVLDFYDVGICLNVSNPSFDYLIGWISFKIGSFGYQLRVPRQISGTSLRYYTLPGARVGKWLFGYEKLTKDVDIIPIVEGPTDALRLGPPAIARLSSDITSDQLKLLSIFSNAHLVFIVDGDDKQKDRKIKKLRKKASSLPGHCHFLVLEDGRDPADYDYEEIWSLIIKTVCNS